MIDPMEIEVMSHLRKDGDDDSFVKFLFVGDESPRSGRRGRDSHSLRSPEK